MCYYDGKGRCLTNVNGEVYQIIDVMEEKTTPVTDLDVIAQLNENMSATRAGGNKLFDINNAVDTPWEKNIDISSGEYITPVLKRYDHKYTYVSIKEPGHYWYNYYFYDYTTEEWTLLGITDVEFNIIFKNWSYPHLSWPGSVIRYCQFVFVDALDLITYNPKTSFNVKIWTNNVA